MRIRVKKKGSLWNIRAEQGYNFTTLTVSDWTEAMRIADLLARGANARPLDLLEIGFLRQLGKRLDTEFTI